MNAADDLFTREDPIFANKELLEISHLPERVGLSAATTRSPTLRRRSIRRFSVRARVTF